MDNIKNIFGNYLIKFDVYINSFFCKSNRFKTYCRNCRNITINNGMYCLICYHSFSNSKKTYSYRIFKSINDSFVSHLKNGDSLPDKKLILSYIKELKYHDIDIKSLRLPNRLEKINKKLDSIKEEKENQENDTEYIIV